MTTRTADSACTYCRGTGVIRHRVYGDYDCPDCGGSGRVPSCGNVVHDGSTARVCVLRPGHFLAHTDAEDHTWARTQIDRSEA